MLKRRKRTTSRHCTGFLPASVLAGLALALFGGLAAAGAADLHKDARSIPPDAGQGDTGPQTLADHRWYVVNGAFDDLGSSFVSIGRIAVPGACKPSVPLLASLYNPAGYFIRRVQRDSDGTYGFHAPGLDGRYLLKLTIADPACAGLRYEIQEFPPPAGAQQDNTKLAEVRACAQARHAVALDRYYLGHHPSPSTRKRFADALKRHTAAVPAACGPVNA